MFICPKCGKSLSCQSRLDYHMSNNVCDKIDRICPKCDKLFQTKSGYQYHISRNVCEHQESEKQPKLKLKLKTKYENMSKEALIQEISTLKGKYEALKESPPQINNNNNNNNIIVFPASFGAEDMDHVKQMIGDILKPVITHNLYRSIPLLFTQIHNNEKLPEYHNVYMSSERSNYAMVSDGKVFKYKPKRTIIDQIIEEKRSLLDRYVDENGEQLGEKVLKKYEVYQGELDDNSEFRKRLEAEIGGLLLDMKAVIANDEKTRQLLDKVDGGQFELSKDDI